MKHTPSLCPKCERPLPKSGHCHNCYPLEADVTAHLRTYWQTNWMAQFMDAWDALWEDDEGIF